MSRSSTAANGSSVISRRSATTIFRCRRSGTSRTDVARLFRPAEHRLVGAVLSGRQYASVRPVRSATDAIRSTTTSRRKPSRSGTSAASDATGRAASMSASPSRANIVNPARLDFVARQRHLHPVPFAGPAAEESDRRPVLRLAGRLSSGLRICGISGSSKSTSWARPPSRISPTAPRTRTGCRATTSCRA